MGRVCADMLHSGILQRYAELLLMRLHIQHQYDKVVGFFFILDKQLVQTNELLGPSKQAQRGNADILF